MTPPRWPPEHPIDLWLLRSPDGRQAGQLTRLSEQVWYVEVDGGRSAVVHSMWCDVLANLPLAADLTGMTATGDSWHLAWNGTFWMHLWPSIGIPNAWATRPGPDSRMVEVLSPDATSAVAAEFCILRAGTMTATAYGLTGSRYFEPGTLVAIDDDGWADFATDLDHLAEIVAARAGIAAADVQVLNR